jgi:hypothetical protein
MSKHIVTQVWETPIESHAAKLVLLALADSMGKNGYCYPSVATIARKCSLSYRAVSAKIAELKEVGLLKVATKKGYSNHYIVTPKPSEKTPENRFDSEEPPLNDVPTPPAPDAHPPGTTCLPPRHDVPTNHKVTNNQPETEPLPAVESKDDDVFILIPDEETKTQKPWTPDPYQQKINEWFGRRDRTRWSDAEIKAYQKLDEQTIKDGIEDLDDYYSASKKLAPFKRKKIITLLNHWVSDMDSWAEWTPETASDEKYKNCI